MQLRTLRSGTSVKSNTELELYTQWRQVLIDSFSLNLYLEPPSVSYLLMNSCNTDISFSNYYHLQSVRFESSCQQRENSYTRLEIHLSPFFALKVGVINHREERRGVAIPNARLMTAVVVCDIIAV